jgi:ribonucleoside-diphosphate reductase alpha chain
MRRYLDGEIDKGIPQQQTIDELEDEGATTDGGANRAGAPDDGGATTESPGEPTQVDLGGDAEADSAGQDDATSELIQSGESPECPDCGSMSLYYSEGCKTCESCGWSEC